jgi:predicted secreted protein
MGVQQNEIYLNAPTRITDNVKVVFGTREQPQVEIDDFEVLKEKEPNRYIRVMQFTAAAFETAVKAGQRTGIIDVSAATLWRRGERHLDCS